MNRCDGCGRPDPQGYHYAHCTLLEDGDFVKRQDADVPGNRTPWREVARDSNGAWEVIEWETGVVLSHANALDEALRLAGLLD